MIKTEIIETTKTIHYCDQCGKQLSHTLACTQAVCSLCGDELCEDCVGNEYNTMGDYRHVYCKTCSDIYNQYKPEIKAHEAAAEALYTTVRVECETAKLMRSADIKE